MRDTLPNLPINSILPEIKSSLEKHNSVILAAEPGSGKTTIIPLALLGEPWLKKKKIIMLEPRRLATPLPRDSPVIKTGRESPASNTCSACVAVALKLASDGVPSRAPYPGGLWTSFEEILAEGADSSFLGASRASGLVRCASAVVEYGHSPDEGDESQHEEHRPLDSLFCPGLIRVLNRGFPDL